MLSVSFAFLLLSLPLTLSLEHWCVRAPESNAKIAAIHWFLVFYYYKRSSTFKTKKNEHEIGGYEIKITVLNLKKMYTYWAWIFGITHRVHRVEITRRKALDAACYCCAKVAYALQWIDHCEWKIDRPTDMEWDEEGERKIMTKKVTIV